MEIHINWLAVIVAAVAHFFVGWLWYSVLFMKPWMQEMGLGKLTAKQRKEGMKDMPKNMAINFATLLVTAWVLSWIILSLKMSGAMGGIQTAFWIWLGFFATTLVNTVLWEKKSWKLYCINVTHHLAGLLVMGIILGAWQ